MTKIEKYLKDVNEKVIVPSEQKKRYPIRGILWFDQQSSEYQSHLERLLKECITSVGCAPTALLIMLRAEECNVPYLV